MSAKRKCFASINLPCQFFFIYVKLTPALNMKRRNIKQHLYDVSSLFWAFFVCKLKDIAVRENQRKIYNNVTRSFITREKKWRFFFDKFLNISRPPLISIKCSINVNDSCFGKDGTTEAKNDKQRSFFTSSSSFRE
jgi:hypothetical protein